MVGVLKIALFDSCYGLFCAELALARLCVRGYSSLTQLIKVIDKIGIELDANLNIELFQI